MRVLVIADIHGNLEALESIDQPFDLCICLGDIVDYGPQPLACLDWVRKHAAYVVRGNHDHGVAQRILPGRDSGYRYLTSVTRPLCWEQLAEPDRQYLARLPLTQYLRIDGKVLLMVHATPRDPLDEYLFADEASWKRRLDQIEADIVCVGHTHHPFELHIGNTTVLNPGSVGQPRDGDPRASFAIIENGQISLHRSAYNIELTIEKLNALDIPEAAKQLSANVWRTGGRVHVNEQAPKHASEAAEADTSAEVASDPQEEPMGTL